MKDVFIVGSKGIPAKYGGFETFVDNLVTRRIRKDIKYHVACMTFNKKCENYNYNGAECQEIKVPNIGGAKAIIYDLRALNWSLEEIRRNKLHDGIIYILACRIGPFLNNYISKFHKYGFKVWVNPDGHEWKRAKWSKIVRKYWKVSERLMVKNADFLVCDSKTIEQYIHNEYSKYSPKTTFIAYGADIKKSSLFENDDIVESWYKQHNVNINKYFLIVGRFVPENNYETVIREFMNSDVPSDLVIITDVRHNNFFEELKKKTNFEKDGRIKFVGTVYNQQLLKFIREHALAYIHGHSVGGTNPSLLEALASTKVNLLYNVGFNKEVAKEEAFYWNNRKNSLKDLLKDVYLFTDEKRMSCFQKSKKRIETFYSWKLNSRYI
ncbi:MAG: DUF1972 domain-containing protein [Liquorilactobacillus ghanensis]|uniref:beta 1-4 rhamnosyltransferase Cps2T n=1 Tax=Liquorilactobacillus ghanensis TaxID=399370 RepID=UPI0039E884E2